MYAVTTKFLDALRASHAVEIKVDAYRGEELLASDLPISDGTVTVDGNSQVRRTLSLTVADPTLDPGNDQDATLAPYGSDLVVQRGVRFPDGSIEYAPLGRFRIEQVQTAISGEAIQLTGSDRTAYVQDARFTTTQQSVTSNTIPAEIARLITAVLTVAVNNQSGRTDATPLVYWEQGRWEAIEQLAKSIGCVVFFDPTGAAVIEPVPAITDAAVWWVDAGESGVLVTGERETTREQTYNGVVASGESAGQFLPYTATVTDNDASSPTLWGGPFGSKPYFYTSPLITTQEQATAAATALLNKVRGMSRQLTLSCVPNPALEAGDVIRVRFPDGATETHLIDSFDMPLDPSSAMAISTRSSAPELE
jgi:hypothetical protein